MTDLQITTDTITSKANLDSWIYRNVPRGQKGEVIQKLYTNLLAVLHHAPNGIDGGNPTINNIFDETEIMKAVNIGLASKIKELLTELSKDQVLMRYMACYVRGKYVGEQNKPDILKDINAAVKVFEGAAPALPTASAP